MLVDNNSPWVSCFYVCCNTAHSIFQLKTMLILVEEKGQLEIYELKWSIGG